MNEHMNVEKALKILQEADFEVSAPVALEARLQEAFRSHHGRVKGSVAAAKLPRRLGLVIGAIAASLLIAAAVRAVRPGSVSAPAVSLNEPLPNPDKPETKRVPKQADRRVGPRQVRVPAPQAQQGATMAARPPLPKEQGREVVTDFFAIPYTPAMTQYDRGQVIRVNIPASSMRSFGLPVPEERLLGRVRADVLMGEDGIARAIRFVR